VSPEIYCRLSSWTCNCVVSAIQAGYSARREWSTENCTTNHSCS